MKELILDNPYSTRRRRYSSRRTKRHRYKFSGFSVRRNPFTIMNVFTKDVAAMGAGALAGTVVSNFVVGRWGAKLPGINNAFGRAAYNLALPVLAGWAVRRFAPNVAKGMVIGGMSNAFGQLVTSTNILPVMSSPAPALPAPATSATGEYLGEYLGNSDAAAVSAAFSQNAWE